MSRGILVKTFIFSVVLSFLLSLGGSVLFGHGVKLDSTLDWEKINSLPYSQAAAYISAHSRSTSRWEILTLQIDRLLFITPQFFVLIGTLFAGGILLVWWVRSERET